MRRINVVKPFNLLLPGEGSGPPLRLSFKVGIHEVGTYRDPVWNRAEDRIIDGEFVEREIGEHPWVKQHCGPMPSPKELLKRAAELTAEAEAIRAQAAEQKAKDEEAGKAEKLARGYEQLGPDGPWPPRAA